MRINDFAKFLDFFLNDGGNVNATNKDGENLAQFLGPHKKAEPFIKVLEARR